MFDPYNRLLQIQGTINFVPFNFAILIQGVEGTGYVGVDNQNIAYRLKRMGLLFFRRVIRQELGEPGTVYKVAR
jgi:hypothetical protein